MNTQYMNEMFTLKKCLYDLRGSSRLERPAARLTKYGLKSVKSYGVKIWNLLPATYTMGRSFGTLKNMIKTWSGNVVSAVCLQLDFPIISMYNNLTSHNCLLC